MPQPTIFEGHVEELIDDLRSTANGGYITGTSEDNTLVHANLRGHDGCYKVTFAHLDEEEYLASEPPLSAEEQAKLDAAIASIPLRD